MGHRSLYQLLFSALLVGIAGTAIPDEDNRPAGVGPALVTRDAAESWSKLLLAGNAFGIPKVTEVTRIRAMSHGPPFGYEIEPFDVPAKFHANLLDSFKDCRIDRDPIISMPEIGSLLIYVGHQKQHLIWYGGAKGAPLMFSWRGVRCICKQPSETTNAMTVLQIIRQAVKSNAE
jgi:hypothetical protein